MGKTEIILTIILFNVFFVLFIVGIFLFIQQYKLKKKEHHAMLFYQKEEHQKELLSAQLEIQQQTMQHIGREIHDNIGQKLTLASLYTQQLAYENKAPHINENIENISAIINQSLAELRELSKSLTNDTINANPITKLLEEECAKINEAKICTVHYTTSTADIRLDYQTKSVLLRIAQEFIQNSIKHAQCENITVSLQLTDEQLLLWLTDDGKGFDTTKTAKGIGLGNMKKRAEIIGGSFDLQSHAGGTQLAIAIPLKP